MYRGSISIEGGISSGLAGGSSVSGMPTISVTHVTKIEGWEPKTLRERGENTSGKA